MSVKDDILNSALVLFFFRSGIILNLEVGSLRFESYCPKNFQTPNFLIMEILSRWLRSNNGSTFQLGSNFHHICHIVKRRAYL